MSFYGMPLMSAAVYFMSLNFFNKMPLAKGEQSLRSHLSLSKALFRFLELGFSVETGASQDIKMEESNYYFMSPLDCMILTRLIPMDEVLTLVMSGINTNHYIPIDVIKKYCELDPFFDDIKVKAATVPAVCLMRDMNYVFEVSFLDGAPKEKSEAFVKSVVEGIILEDGAVYPSLISMFAPDHFSM